MSESKYTPWYVIDRTDNYGRIRLRFKPTDTQVEGGAGSSGSALPKSLRLDSRYQRTQLMGKAVIRFVKFWANKEQQYLETKMTWQEYRDTVWKQENPNQASLGAFDL